MQVDLGVAVVGGLTVALHEDLVLDVPQREPGGRALRVHRGGQPSRLGRAYTEDIGGRLSTGVGRFESTRQGNGFGPGQVDVRRMSQVVAEAVVGAQ